MMKVIIFCERQVQNMLKKSIAEEVEILEWIYMDHINEELEDCIEKIYPYYKETMGPVACIMSGIRRNKEVILRMLTAMGVSQKNILDVYKTYRARFPRERYRRIMDKWQRGKLDGIILGISHGLTGILENYMPGVCCNFCESSQDIHFNYKTLQGLYFEYYMLMQDIKYAVIDMFDYTYFNYDTLQTGECETYLEESGFICENRLLCNQVLVEEINEKLRTRWSEGTNNEERELLNEIFPKIEEADPGVYREWVILEERKHNLTEKEINEYKEKPFFSSIQLKVFEATLEFQIDNFYKMIHFLKRINPKIKIYLLLIPKYCEVEEMESTVNSMWKKLFMEIVNKIQNEYSDIELLDLKNYKQFSTEKENYYDLTHFNYIGAQRFTEYLSNLIIKSM